MVSNMYFLRKKILPMKKWQGFHPAI